MHLITTYLVHETIRIQIVTITLARGTKYCYLLENLKHNMNTLSFQI